MTNIPTELLRTLIAVVDLRSFTRAAHSLGVTQPAVSAQVKRLQAMLGGELFDKSAPGVTLTPKGEVVVNFARRLLSINDQILDMTTRNSPLDRLRIGIPTGDPEPAVLQLIAKFRDDHPQFHVQVCNEPSDNLLREFRRGEYDLIAATADEEQPIRPRWSWQEKTAWCAASPSAVPNNGPIPLVVLGEGSLTRRMSVKALEEAGEEYEIAYVGRSYAGLIAAVSAGLGVACWAQHRLLAAGLPVFEQTPRLPKLADVTLGVYIGEGREGTALDDLASRIASVIRPAEADPTVRRIAVAPAALR